MRCCGSIIVALFVGNLLLNASVAWAWVSDDLHINEIPHDAQFQPSLKFNPKWNHYARASLSEFVVHLKRLEDVPFHDPFHIYFTAKSLAQKNDDAMATILLDEVKHALGHTSDFFAYKQGLLYQETGNYEQAFLSFEEATSSIRRDLRLQAQIALAEMHLEMRSDEAEQYVRELFDQYPKLPQRPELMLSLGRMYESSENFDEALKIYREIHLQFPGTFVEQNANQRINHLNKRGFKTEPLNTTDQVTQFIKLVGFGFVHQAKKIQSQIALNEVEEDLRAQFHYRSGYIKMVEGDFRSARKSFKQAFDLLEENEQTALSSRFKNRVKERMEDAWEVSVSQRRNLAKKRIQILLKKRKNKVHKTDKLLEAFDIAYRANLPSEAKSIASSLIRKKKLSSKNRLLVSVGLRQMKLYKLAIKFLAPLKKRTYYKHAALFHEARIKESKGDLAASVEQYQSLMATREDAPFYALLAEQRLLEVNQTQTENTIGSSSKTMAYKFVQQPEKIVDQLTPLIQKYDAVYPWLRRAKVFVQLREYQAASDELFEMYLEWRAARKRTIRRAGLWSVATGENLPKLQFQETKKHKMLSLEKEELDTLAKIANALGDMGLFVFLSTEKESDKFLRPFASWVQQVAEKYHVDPNLLFAVMRIESVYQPRIVSHAGAIGLMQIMPRTGRLIAHELGKNDFTHDDLLDPHTNIEFAGWYLSSLIKRFDGNIALAIAAYNGGPHNVNRWIDLHPKNTPFDIFVERIPFRQTRRYVRRVLAAYFQYRANESLPRKQLSFELSEYQPNEVLF